MSWAVEGAPETQTWSGVSSIFDPLYSAKGRFLMKWYLPFLISGLIIGKVVLDLNPNDNVWDGLTIIAFSPIFAIIPPVIAKLLVGEIDNFLRQSWVLVGDDEGLTFSPRQAPAPFSSKSWRVSIDEVSSVEAGRTVEWAPARRFRATFKSDELQSTPEHEWQAFIITRSGLRLVIHTANADREGCAALAASVRAWIEAHRAAPDLAASSTAQEEGFSL